MPSDLPSIPGRPDFTHAQKLQARLSGVILDRHRKDRRSMPTHPIDNVEPQVVADRDDGILVETRQQGEGYRVYVTIADVAAYVRANSELSYAAHARATSLYGRGSHDPMFPLELEHRMSLEHQQERLGMLVAIDLDKNFQPVHTELESIVTTADGVSYAQAQARMQSDPQFQLMHHISEGVKQNYFSQRGLAWNDLEMGHRLRRSEMPTQEAAMHMVATYMLLANSCVANFFAKSDVPFLYRNFNEDSAQPRAYYSTLPERHSALEKSGLRGAYCHVTSPIRRAADYINGGSMHYAIRILRQAEQGLLKAYPSANAAKLHHGLWQRGPEILRAIQQAQAEEPTIRGEPAHISGHYLPKMHLDQALGYAVKDALPEGATLRPHGVERVMNQLLCQPFGFSQQTLEQQAQHINRINHSDAMRQHNRQNDKHEQDLDNLDSLPTHWGNTEGSKFSSLLLSAARTGRLDDALYREALKRIRSDRFENVLDSFAILFIAEPEGAEWLELKRATCLAIKHRPEIVNNLLNAAREYLAPAVIEEIPASLPVASGEYNTAEEAQYVHAVIVSQQDGPGHTPVAPPFYSIGHNSRAAVSHARFTYLEHYAFGQLQPISQSNLPSLMYAELDMPDRRREEVVQAMLDTVGAKLEIETVPSANGFMVSAKAVGGVFDSPVEEMGEDADAEIATKFALRRLLRNRHFKYAVSAHDEDVNPMLHPQRVLEELVQEQGGTLEALRPESVGAGGRSLYRAEVNLKFVGRTETFTGTGPNMDRALRAACIEALDSFGWQVPDHTSPAQSWVTDLQRETTARTNGRG